MTFVSGKIEGLGKTQLTVPLGPVIKCCFISSPMLLSKCDGFSEIYLIMILTFQITDLWFSSYFTCGIRRYLSGESYFIAFPCQNKLVPIACI